MKTINIIAKLGLCLMMLAGLAASAEAQTENPEKLSVDIVSVAPGEEATVTVNYASAVERSGFQVNVVLPKGLEFVKTDNAEEGVSYIFLKGTSCLGSHIFHEAELTKYETPATMLICYNLNYLMLKEGSLFTFKVRATEELAEKAVITFEQMKFNGGEYLSFTGEAVNKALVSRDITFDAESGDIAAGVAELQKGLEALGVKAENIVVNLKKDGAYTVGSPIEAGCNLTINGNGATVDASANEGVLLSLTDGKTVEGSSYKRIDNIKIDGVTVKGVKNSLVYDNNKQICVVDLTINNSVIELATEAAQNEALISFQAGGVKDVNILNSTFYGNNAVAKYFIRYNNSARLDRYGFDKDTEFQTMNYQNNTFHGLLKADGQWGNYNGISGQNFSKFDVKNNIWYNCGNDIIRRMAGGRFGSNSPLEFANNTYFNEGADKSASEASYDKSGSILVTDPAFTDAANADFHIGASTQQAKFQTGDPRWLTEFVAPTLDKTALAAEVTAATELLGEASTEEGTPGAALQAAIDAAKTALEGAEFQEEIDAALKALQNAEEAYKMAVAKAALEAEITAATTLLGEDPAEEGTPGAALYTAIEEAMTALSSAKTPEELEAALTALKAAEDAYKTANAKTALEDEIAAATELLGDASTEEGTPGAALKAAIDEAKAALENAKTPEELAEALAALKAAEDAYETAVAKASLEDEITAATELLGDASTDEGTPGAALKAAIDEAKAALENAKTPEELAEALAALKAAEDAYETATGIYKITAEEDVNAPVYNLAGQRVAKTAKGIVIKNGKKYMTK